MPYHPRSENPAYDTTQWDELQKKHGNLEGVELGSDRLRAAEAAEKAALEQLEEARAAEVRQEERKQADVEWEETAMLGELDDVDEEEAKFMLEYRAKRVQEMQEEAKKAKFGDVIELSTDAFRREVTDAADGELRVVVHLYCDNTPECQVVDALLRVVARRHPRTKFARIFYLSAIANYPLANLPTILVYHQHDIALSIVTLRQLGGLEALSGAHGESIFTAALSTCGAVPPMDMKDMMKPKVASARASAARSDSDEDISD